MVVDDCLIDRVITTKIIAKNNFTEKVLEYALPEKALVYLQENSQDSTALPQVILLDINMPEISGFQFMEIYDKLPATVRNYCKVYMISSTVDEDELILARNLKNISGFHSKPINTAFLENM